MAFKVKIRDIETGKEIEAAALRSTLWDALDYKDQLPETQSKDQRADYAWAFFAARRAGILAKIGIDDDIQVDDAIADMADRFDVSFEEVASAPLEGKTAR